MIEREEFFRLAEKSCVLVCQEEKTVIGVLCFTQTEITGLRKMPGKVLYIDFLAVLESASQKGGWQRSSANGTYNSPKKQLWQRRTSGGCRQPYCHTNVQAGRLFRKNH